MKYAPIDLNKIRDLEADIQQNIAHVRKFVACDIETFRSGVQYYGAAEHCFRRMLEGILTIGLHILSRLPVRTKDYQEVIVELGKNGIIPMEFAEKNKSLAGYRNRMVHMYWEVTPDEMYSIINEHVDDIDKFCEYYREVVLHPEKFGLRVDE